MRSVDRAEPPMAPRSSVDSNRNAGVGDELEHPICKFKDRSWGGCRLGDRCGTGACLVLREMGFRNL